MTVVDRARAGSTDRLPGKTPAWFTFSSATKTVLRFEGQRLLHIAVSARQPSPRVSPPPFERFRRGIEERCAARCSALLLSESVIDQTRRAADMSLPTPRAGTGSACPDRALRPIAAKVAALSRLASAARRMAPKSCSSTTFANASAAKRKPLPASARIF